METSGTFSHIDWFIVLGTSGISVTSRTLRTSAQIDFFNSENINKDLIGTLETFAQIDFCIVNVNSRNLRNFGKLRNFYSIVILFSKLTPGTLGTLGTSGTFAQTGFFLFSKYKLGTLGILGTSETFFRIVIYYQNQDQKP